MKKNEKKKYDDYIGGTKTLLDRSQKEKRPYEVKILGKSFLVYPKVFSPKYFKDTVLFAKHLPINSGDVFLEIGTGTGAVAITAAYRGAKNVVAVDINRNAVKNAEDNVRRHGFENSIDIRHGDIYSPVKPTEKFDVIFWNVPFGFVASSRKISMLERAVYDPEYTNISRFFGKASDHLLPDGRIFVGFSSTLGKLSVLQQSAKKAGWRLRRIFSGSSREIHPVRFEIFEGYKI